MPLARSRISVMTEDGKIRRIEVLEPGDGLRRKFQAGEWAKVTEIGPNSRPMTPVWMNPAFVREVSQSS